MKEIKKEITTEQVVYEISKEELERIKREERNKGRDDMAGYLCFAIKNYYLEFNLAGICEIFADLSAFFNKDTVTIKNVYGYSFRDYVEIYRQC